MAPVEFTERQRLGYRVSLALTMARLVLAPVLLALLHLRAPGWTFAVVLVVGFLSDVFDGRVARRYGVSTPGLRRLDSAVDIVFYVAVAYASWRLHPEQLRPLAWPITAILAGEAANHLLALAKFRREPSYHAWSAKALGALLFTSLGLLLGAGAGTLLPLTAAVGLIAEAEILAITIVLPIWHHDVHSVWHARRLRRQRAIGVS